MTPLEKELAEVVRLLNTPFHPYLDRSRAAYRFVEAHHAEIASNARRLRALERAMGEVNEDGFPKYSGPAIIWIRQRADEIMREGAQEKAE